MMMRVKDCFYCQALGGVPAEFGNCDFCGKKSKPAWVPLYLVQRTKKSQHFCCVCAYWQFPRSEAEKKAEAEWYQKYKLYRDIFYLIKKKNYATK